MSSKTHIEIRGDKGLAKAINALPIKIARKALRKAIRAGNTIERKAMKKAAPVGPSRGRFPGGELKKSIKSKVKVYPRSNTAVGITGPDYSKSKVLHLTEEGTQPRTTKSGKYTGRVEGTHWASAAHDTVKAASLAKMRHKLLVEVEAETKKLAEVPF